MIHYKLLVVHWSIFTLSVQLIYCVSLHSSKYIHWFNSPLLIRKLAIYFAHVRKPKQNSNVLQWFYGIINEINSDMKRKREIEGEREREKKTKHVAFKRLRVEKYAHTTLVAYDSIIFLFWCCCIVNRHKHLLLLSIKPLYFSFYLHFVHWWRMFLHVCYFIRLTSNKYVIPSLSLSPWLSRINRLLDDFGLGCFICIPLWELPIIVSSRRQRESV